MSLTTKHIFRELNDLLVYGTLVNVAYQRAWYNPMRWINGKIGYSRVDPKSMYMACSKGKGKRPPKK